MRAPMADQHQPTRSHPCSIESPQRRLRVVAVASGNGGVGKTNIAVNLAVLAAREGRRVLLIDGDLGIGSAQVLLGVRPRHHIGLLFDGSLDLNQVLTACPGGIQLLAGGAGASGLGSVKPEEQLRLLAALDDMEDQFDLVLIDCGSGLTDTARFFAGAAEEVLLVVSTEPTSLAAGGAALKVLGQAVTRFQVVVNPVADERTAREWFAKLTRDTASFQKAEVRYLGCVPYDQNLRRAVAWQRPLAELFPRTPASNALRAIERALFARHSPAQLGGGLKFLSQRLLRESMQ